MTMQSIIYPTEISSHTLSLSSEDTLKLDFDTDAASFDRSENDLVLTFNNGSQITVEDFFVRDGEHLPALQLADGSVVEVADFLRSMNPDMDVTTAAGPSSTTQGSGAGEYADGAGDLLGGVDRLGSLGTTHWQGNAAPLREVEGLSALGIGGTTSDIIAPNPDYTTRAVVYNTDSATTTVRFYLADASGRILATDPSALSGYSLFSETGLVDIDLNGAKIHPDGSISLPLSSAYLEMVADNGGVSGMQNLDDYITFTDASGDKYTMQVVINHTGNYTPQDAEALRDTDILDMEEWHSSSSPVQDPTSKESGDGNDAMWFTAEVKASDGQKNTIDAKDGDNTITFSENVAANGGSNEITTGKGNDTITFSKNVAVDGGYTEVTTGAGDDTITIAGAVTAKGGSYNRFELGAIDVDGNNTFLVNNGGISALSDSLQLSSNKIFLQTVTGDNTATVSEGDIESTKGNNDLRLHTTTGDNTFRLGHGSITTNDRSETYVDLSTQNGKNSITLDNGGITSAYGGITSLFLKGHGDSDYSTEGNTLHIKGDINTGLVGGINSRTTIFLNGEKENSVETGAISTSRSLSYFSTDIDGGAGAQNEMSVTGNITHTGTAIINANQAVNQLGNSLNFDNAGEGTNTLNAHGLETTGKASLNRVTMQGGKSSDFHLGENGIVTGDGMKVDRINHGQHSSSRTVVTLESEQNTVSIGKKGIETSGVMNSSGATMEHATIATNISMIGKDNAFTITGGGGITTSGQGKIHGTIKSSVLLTGDKNLIDISGALSTEATESKTEGVVTKLSAIDATNNEIFIHNGIETTSIATSATSATSKNKPKPVAVTELEALGLNNTMTISNGITTSGRQGLTKITMASDKATGEQANALTINGNLVADSYKGESGAIGGENSIYLQGGDSKVIIEGALSAKGNGKNLIDSSDLNSGTLGLTIKAGSGNAALSTDVNSGSTNTIEGSALDDIIQITGNIDGKANGNNFINMHDGDDTFILAGDMSGLHLTTGEGKDKIDITGDIKQFRNIILNNTIDMGDDDDVFLLNGNMTGLTLNMGTGNDKAVITGNISSKSTIDMGDDNDTLTISGKVTTSNGGKLLGGEGYDTLSIGEVTHLNNKAISGDGKTLKLSALFGDTINGFENLNLEGGAGTHLTIDWNSLTTLQLDAHDNFLTFSDVNDGSLADSLNGENTLMIHGDEKDSVTFQSGFDWDKAGTVTHGENLYTVYSNGAEDADFILVQQIISITG